MAGHHQVTRLTWCGTYQKMRKLERTVQYQSVFKHRNSCSKLLTRLVLVLLESDVVIHCTRLS